MNKKAFTLIELLIVVALIGILSSIGVITFQGQIKASKQKKAEINLNSINLALQEYKSNNGSYYYVNSCSSTSNKTINDNLFDGVKNLAEKSEDMVFQYCITKRNEDGFTIKATNPDTNCEITLKDDLDLWRDPSNC